MVGSARVSCVVGLALAAVADSAAAVAPLVIEPVVLSGAPAPGTTWQEDPDPFLSVGGRTTISNNGDVAFYGAVVGARVSGVWAGRPGALQLVALGGAAAPGTNSSFADFGGNPLYLDDAGNIALRGRLLHAPPDGDEGVWAGPPGSLALVALEGAPVPGMPPGVVFGADAAMPEYLAFGRGGALTFSAFVSGPGGVGLGDQLLWQSSGGSLQDIARPGGNVAGTAFIWDEIGGIIDPNDPHPAVNRFGDVAFKGAAYDGPTSIDGIWLGGSSSFALVAADGDVAPGTSLSFETIQDSIIGINDGADVVFSAIVGVATPKTGIWAGGSGALTKISLQGDPAPGVLGGIFGPLPTATRVVMNNLGQVAFLGMTTTGRPGIWIGDGSTLRKVVFYGSPAPGTPPGVVFGTCDPFFLNDRGQVLLLGRVSGPGVNSSNDFGLWLEDVATASLRLVVREGAAIAVGGGETKTIQSLSLTSGFSHPAGSSDGASSALNDRGVFAFGATFTDGGSGVFIGSFSECGNGFREVGEECDGVDDDQCSGGCLAGCVCENICGDGVVAFPEECDGAAEAACPGLCVPPGGADGCTCAPLPPLAEAPSPVAKNRYASFVVDTGGVGSETALRVRLRSLHHPANPPPGTPNFAAYEGQYRYVSLLAPDTVMYPGTTFGATFAAAGLSCAPEYRDWAALLGGATLHVTGREVVPSSIYDVANLPLGCAGHEAACEAASAEIAVATTRWGDVDGNGAVDIRDVASVVDAARNLPTALSKPRTQLQPGMAQPAAAVSVLDISAASDALRSMPYPFAGPADCP